MIPKNVVITDSLAEELGATLRQKSYSKIAVLVDENTERSCLPLIVDQLPGF